MKTAIVTGATKGIGRAAAIALADEGWWVLATGRDEVDGAELEKELDARAGGRFAAVELTAPGAADALVDPAGDRQDPLPRKEAAFQGPPQRQHPGGFQQDADAVREPGQANEPLLLQRGETEVREGLAGGGQR